MNNPTYYDLLQVTPDADIEIIEAVYRRLIKRYHPDVSSNPDALEITKKLNEAYDILRDPVKRARYDDELRRSSPRQSDYGRRQEEARSNNGSHAAAIRRHIIQRYIVPARQREIGEITIRAGTVADEMGLSGRIPNVCQALGGRILSDSAQIQLIRKAGPKASSTSTFTFRL